LILTKLNDSQGIVKIISITFTIFHGSPAKKCNEWMTQFRRVPFADTILLQDLIDNTRGSDPAAYLLW
jgi:hypothetical protein